MARVKGCIEERTIVWEYGKEYIFKGKLLVNPDKKWGKNAWRGSFIGTPPDGLEAGKEYCLKEITVFGTKNKHPQKREYYDLVGFQGDHLRQILARNSYAKEVEEELIQEGNLKPHSRLCYIVEPAYALADEWFCECWRKPVADRLDLIGQYAKGCLELRDQCNRLNGYTVDSHRDIKKENGLLEMIGDEIRVRLIDYASIHLEKEADNWEACESSDAEETYGGFLTTSNTAPEDLCYTDWKVCATTDVYALGMMLASMFVHTNGKYFNPNSAWLGSIPNDEQAMERLDEEISSRLKKYQQWYDQTAGTEAWVEKVLQQRNVTFRWEDLSDQNVLAQIRALFVCATRIDPQKRIDLESFIQKIGEIQQMARESRKRFPVSVYMFEQTDFDKYAHAYEQAAANVFRKEGTATRALCVRYHRLITRQSAPRDAIFCQEEPCRNEHQLHEFIEQTSKANGRGPDMTALALYVAGMQMEKRIQSYAFTGNVYLFCPAIPQGHQIQSGIEGIVSVCNRLGQMWEKPTFIDAHVIQKRRDDGEEEQWCSQELIPYVEPPEPDRKTETGNSDNNMLPYGRMYVTLPDGTIFWL